MNAIIASQRINGLIVNNLMNTCLCRLAQGCCHAHYLRYYVERRAATAPRQLYATPLLSRCLMFSAATPAQRYARSYDDKMIMNDAMRRACARAVRDARRESARAHARDDARWRVPPRYAYAAMSHADAALC